MDGDKFTFTLTAKDNAPMPEGENANKLTITNASLKEMDDERLGDFPEITFTKPGTYTYYITEKKESTPGLIYDTSKYKVVVTVSG